MPRILARTTATLLVAAIAVASCSYPAARSHGARTPTPPSAPAAKTAIAATLQPPTAALPAAADLGAGYAVVRDVPTVRPTSTRT
jgi:hypothetical protein